MKMNDSDLFFTCSLLEEIGRETRQRRRDVVALLGRKVVAHIYENAGTLHCEPVPKTAEVFIRLAGIPQGKFDNVATCQYTVPDYWTIGKVYARLIEDVCDTNVIDTLLQIYESPVSDAISNYNSDFFYQPRGFLKEQFLQLPTPPHHPNAPTPKIRFQNFSEKWEKRKLGECFNERNERSAEGELLSVTINSGIRKFDELGRNDNSSEDKSHYKRVLPGDIAYNSMRMWQGASGHSPYDGIVSPAYTVITPREGVSSIFFSYLFKRESMIQIFQNRSQGITSDTWNLKFPAFSEIDTALPTKPEQEKIGVFFQKLDRLIALHREKEEKLRNLKKALLERMFPRQGRKVPGIRFAGFAEPWKERKAKDLFEVTAEKNHPELPVLAATQEYGMVKREENGINIHHDKRNEATYKRVMPGQFVIHLRSFQGGFAHSDFEGITSPAYTVFGFKQPEEHDSYFWKYVFHSDCFIHRLETVTYGIRDGRSISYEEFSGMDFFVPSREEQKRISAELLKLDRLISLYQRRGEKLRCLKEGCLSGMFV